MADDPNEPVELASFTTEFQAATVARALEARGIKARVIGALTTGFRAEAPGVARVMVLRKDLERAKGELATMPAESEDVDWAEADAAPAPLPFEGAVEGRAESGDGKSWGWTVVLVILAPLGLFLTWVGNRPGADAVSRAIGPVILAVAAVLVVWMVTSGGEGEEREGRH